MRKNRITAIILTLNEEKQIWDCLDSIKWVDEIIVIDSKSTDRTIDICRKYTDKIYQREYQRYANTRNWSLQFASHDWILAVDADERYTPEIADEIRESLGKDKDGYQIPYIYFCFGKEMRYWRRGEEHLRLFKKELGYWEDREVHAKIIVNGKLGKLKNYVLHFPYPRFNILWEKTRRYTLWDAEERLKTRRSFNWYEPLMTIGKPFYNFFHFYFLQRVYKDGFAGFLVCLVRSLYTFLTDCKFYILVIKNAK